MLSVARHRVATERPTDSADRFEWILADAADMPLPDAAFDVVTSVFMLQLVPDRAAVLREVRRVLRPGGTLALVAWLDRDLVMPADAIFDEVISELGLEHPGDDGCDPRTSDFRNVEEARLELRSAGFGQVADGPDEVLYSWSRDGYLDFKESYDEFDLFDSLATSVRSRLKSRLTERWSELPDAAFALRGQAVWAISRRPAPSPG